MTCPSCGSPGAYVGLAKVECDREGCEKYVKRMTTAEVLRHVGERLESLGTPEAKLVGGTLKAVATPVVTSSTVYNWSVTLPKMTPPSAPSSVMDVYCYRCKARSFSPADRVECVLCQSAEHLSYVGEA